MKKIIALLLAIMMLCGITAFAEEAAVDEADRNYAPESGTGWMSVDIHGEHEELTYVESVRSLSGSTYIFEMMIIASLLSLTVTSKLESPWERIPSIPLRCRAM